MANVPCGTDMGEPGGRPDPGSTPPHDARIMAIAKANVNELIGITWNIFDEIIALFHTDSLKQGFYSAGARMRLVGTQFVCM